MSKTLPIFRRIIYFSKVVAITPYLLTTFFVAKLLINEYLRFINMENFKYFVFATFWSFSKILATLTLQQILDFWNFLQHFFATFLLQKSHSLQHYLMLQGKMSMLQKTKPMPWANKGPWSNFIILVLELELGSYNLTSGLRPSVKFYDPRSRPQSRIIKFHLGPSALGQILWSSFSTSSSDHKI